ncbi:hypothetical protein LTR84_003463 [Exophiala bonariae]|uniref:Beta-lactamase-related domain-containing protein n=1 Tax=Exophiala bonariae TaxID=1690606 RepID=A0AAV9NB21_9EURO|nr:hypothetical protein LTR84_003463 [Exophiala bonariae]
MKELWKFIWALIAVATIIAAQAPKIDLALLGPIYQPAANSSFKAFDDARAQATEAIKQIISSGNSTYGPFDQDTTSFSVSVFSKNDDALLFEFHYEASELNGSYTKGSLTENTIYRTGSLGKLMTVYTWLVNIGDSVFSDPITKYIPELAQAEASYIDPILSTNWSEITIGALASHQSGLGRDWHLTDMALTTFEQPPVSVVEQSGYPVLANDEVVQCNFYGNQPSCTRSQALDGIINHPPSFLPYSTPSYSNIAFILLSLAYETITGESIDQGQHEVLNSRLGMVSTTPRPPGGEIDAIIPFNDTFARFHHDLGLLSPVGGQYTTLKDLQTWGRAILNSTLLPRAQTDRWLKPRSFTSQWHSAVGAPFEIYRHPIPANSIINSSRIIDTYCKQGGLFVYSTYFGLVPDLDIGISLLSAGVNSDRQIPPIRDTLVQIFYQAAEAAAKEQAKTAFTGTYQSSSGNSSITLAVDGGPGVAVTSWTSNGVNFLDTVLLSSYNSLRLYPTKRKTEKDGIEYYGYHLELLPNNGEPTTADFWNHLDEWWIQMDTLIYNNLATDAFTIGFDKDGIVQSVASQALRTILYRIA